MSEKKFIKIDDTVVALDSIIRIDPINRITSGVYGFKVHFVNNTFITVKSVYGNNNPDEYKTINALYTKLLTYLNPIELCQNKK